MASDGGGLLLGNARARGAVAEAEHRLGVVVVEVNGGQADVAGRQLGRRHELPAADAVPAALLDGVAVRARRRHGASSNSSPGWVWPENDRSGRRNRAVPYSWDVP